MKLFRRFSILIVWIASLAGAWAQAVEGQSSGEEIVVVGSKTARPLSRIPGHIVTFERQKMEWQQIQNLGDIARYEPALEADFSTPRFGSTGLSIRGIGGNRVALELDGVPLPRQFDIGNFADSGRLALDAEVIENIEILRGSVSALYGSDAIGGVVAVSTIDPRDLAGADDLYAGVGGGWFGVNNSTWGQLTGAWANDTQGLMLSVSRRDGRGPDNEARDVPDDRIDFGQWQVFGKYVHEFGHGGLLAASFDLYRRQVDSDLRTVLGYQRFADTTGIRGNDAQLRSRFTARYTLDGLPWLDEFSLTAYRQINDTEQHTAEERSGGVPLRLNREFFFEERSFGGEARLRRDFSTHRFDHVLVAGLEWDHRHIVEHRDAVQTNRLTGTTSRNLLGERFPLRDFPDTRTDEIGVYLQNEVSYGRVSLIPALRWDGYSLDAQTDSIFTDPARLTDLKLEDVTFRLGLVFRAIETLTVYGHYSEGFRAPPPEDVNLFLDLAMFNVRAIPNADLKAETSRNFELGLRWHGDAVTLKAAAYYSTFENFIESRARLSVDPPTGVLLFQSRNLDEEATIYGFEADMAIPLKSLHAKLANWSFDAGVHWARGENDITGAPLNEVSPLKAVLGLRWHSVSDRLESGLRLRYLHDQSRTDFSGGEFFVPPSATVIDVTMRYTPSDWITWHLGLYNLTDRRYWRYSDVRARELGDPRIKTASRPGRHVNLTLRFHY